jgi:hypothetical protein
MSLNLVACKAGGSGRHVVPKFEQVSLPIVGMTSIEYVNGSRSCDLVRDCISSTPS